MKLLHFLIIIIPVAISLLVVLYIIIPVTMFVQPLKATIIGYRPYTCNNSTNSCMSSSPILFGNNSNVFHKGDRFLFYVSVTNPNFFPIVFDSASTTFDKNAINYHYSGCAGAMEEIGVVATESSEMTIPNSDCDIYIAISAGESKATILLQYHINGKPYSVSASKTFTILPTIKENYGTLSGNVSKTDYMPCVHPCSEKIFYPSANYEVDIYANDKVTLIGKTFSDASAYYSIQLPAGNYTIFTGLIWNKQTNQVSVFAGKNTIFNIVWGNTA